MPYLPLRRRWFALALLATLVPTPAPSRAAAAPLRPAPPGRAAVSRLTVTVLSTMLAGNPNRGIGEWGYAALIEVDGARYLFDTGARPDVVLHNARELGIDLATVTDVILSHNHGDHTGGLLTLRRAVMGTRREALSRVHVARGIFWVRPDNGTDGGGTDGNGLRDTRAAYEATGGTFIEHDGPVELMPGVWFTGPVPRPFAERNWSGRGTVVTPAGTVEDTVPEDASVVINTASGLVVVSGCGHSGIINTVTYARQVVRAAPIHAAIGGFHLFAATDQQLQWTAAQLKGVGLAYLLAGHCTGIEATYRLRDLAGLTRKTAVVSAVGSSFTLGQGLTPLSLAQ
jgi:7,8-dihydropterin-6-yl-methyl-4-(beta-D-ribofuranosyl)aminobenzene 5'-phosphate synthase